MYSITDWLSAVEILKVTPQIATGELAKRVGCSSRSASEIIEQYCSIHGIQRPRRVVTKRTGLDYQMGKIYRNGLKKTG